MPPGLRGVKGGGEIRGSGLGDVERQLTAREQRRRAGRATGGAGRGGRTGSAACRHGSRIAGVRRGDPGWGSDIGVRGLRGYRKRAAPSLCRPAYLRDAGYARFAGIAAKLDDFGARVRITKIRGRLAGQKATQCAVGIEKTRDKIVRHRQRARPAGDCGVRAGPIPCHDRPRFAKGGWRAAFEDQP